VRDALRAENKTALGQLTMRGREYLCAIRPCGDGLLLETLRYEDEVRKADPLFSSIEDDTSNEELLEVATQLIRRKSGPFDPGAFRDNYDQALRTLIEAKRKNRKTPRALVGHQDEARPTGENVVDLMAALKESLKKDGGRTPRKSSSGAAAKPVAKTGARRAAKIAKTPPKPPAKPRKSA